MQRDLITTLTDLDRESALVELQQPVHRLMKPA